MADRLRGFSSKPRGFLKGVFLKASSRSRTCAGAWALRRNREQRDERRRARRLVRADKGDTKGGSGAPSGDRSGGRSSSLAREARYSILFESSHTYLAE